MAILVLNLGLNNIRSVVFSIIGEKLSYATRRLETSLNGEMLTQNPTEWWNKASEVISESISCLRGVSIEYISITSSSSCLVYVDENCYPLDKCIMVSDKRAKDEANTMKNAPSFRLVREETNTQSDESLMLPKILWVKNNQPELFAQSHKFLSPNDYFVARMTGRYVTDYFNAQKYHYLINRKSYPIGLLDELSININLLPEVVSPGSLAGELIDSVASELGIPKQNKPVKVIISSYDAICSFFGSGCINDGDACDVSGTVTAFRVLSKQKK